MKLRPAAIADRDLLYDWVNRPDSLNSKLRTSGPIDRATHGAWLHARLSDPDTRISIVMETNEPIGQVRLQRGDCGYEVDIYIAACARGRGVGRRALQAHVEATAAWRSDAPLIARVRSDNLASRRLFSAMGFHIHEQFDDHVVYRYDG